MDSVSLLGRVGEGRACWSLGNAYVSMGSPAQALTFAKKHLEISQEVSGLALPSAPDCCLGQRWRPPGTAQPAADCSRAFVCSGLFPDCSCALSGLLLCAAQRLATF